MVKNRKWEMISQNMKILVPLILLFLGAGGLNAQVEQVGQHDRVALVMGNSTYLTGPLRNTVNDARAMALTLESAGFEVILKENVTNRCQAVSRMVIDGLKPDGE